MILQLDFFIKIITLGSIIYFIFMAFTLDRTEAAKRLGVSTRTIDRHIQNNRIRTRRIGKKMFLDENDVESLRNEDTARREDDYEVITNEESTIVHDEELMSYSPNSMTLSPDTKLAIAEFSRIYSNAQDLLSQKEETIKDLSYKLGTAETELKNSVNIAEYNKTAHLLETVQAKNNEDSRYFGEKISHLEKEVQKKNSFIVGMVILFVLVIISTLFFVFYSRFF